MWDWQKVVFYLIRVFVLFLSVSIHEYAHAKSAYNYGDDTAYNAGRVSLNPARHFEPIGLILLLVGAPVAWGKPVPVNSANFRADVNRKNAILWVSLAGICANLALAFISMGLAHGVSLIILLNRTQMSAALYNVLDVLNNIFTSLVFTNINLAVFNILPVPPLDGFELLDRVLPAKASYWLKQNSKYINLVMILLIVFFNSAFSKFMSTLINPVVKAFDWPFTKLDQLIIKSLQA